MAGSILPLDKGSFDNYAIAGGNYLRGLIEWSRRQMVQMNENEVDTDLLTSIGYTADQAANILALHNAITRLNSCLHGNAVLAGDDAETLAALMLGINAT